MLRLFHVSFIVGKATSSHFFKVATSTQQLLFRNSYFFRASAFLEELLVQKTHFLAVSCYFFRIAAFSGRIFYRAAT